MVSIPSGLALDGGGSMLKITKILDKYYICNQCGWLFDLKDAYIKRGNGYFCSKKCVLAYDKEVTCGS